MVMERKRLFSRKSVGVSKSFVPGSLALKRFTSEPDVAENANACAALQLDMPPPATSTSNSTTESPKPDNMVSSKSSLPTQSVFQNNQKKLTANSTADNHDDSSSASSMAVAPAPTALQPRIFPPPKRARKSISSASTTSTSGSSRRSKAPPLPSPYEDIYSAEDNEPLFDELEEAVHNWNSPILALARSIQKSKLIYSKTWLEDGRVEDKNFGTSIQPSNLVLCLNKHMFYEADVPVLKCMATTMGLESVVKELVNASKKSKYYPKTFHPSSRLIKNARKDVLKSILFLARVYCAKKFLKTPMDEWEGNLKGKVDRCLQIVEEHADLQAIGGQERTGASIVTEEATPALTQEKSPRRVSIDQETTPVRKNNSKGESMASGRKRDHEECVKTQQASDTTNASSTKKRRVSLNDLNPLNLLEVVASESGKPLPMQQRIETLELFFRKGLQAMQQLRAEFEEEKSKQQSAAVKRSPQPKPMSPTSPSLSLTPDQSNPNSVATLSPPVLAQESNYSSSDELVDSDEEEEAGSQVCKRKNSGIRKYRKVLEADEDDEGSGGTINMAIEKERKCSPASEPTDPPSKNTSKDGTSANDELVPEINEVVKAKVWRQCKFLKGPEHLEKACKYVANELKGRLEDLGMSVETFTEQHGGTISRAVALLRNRVQAPMRKAVFAHLDENDGFLPMVEELTKLRQSKTAFELDCHFWLWDSLVPCVSQGSLWAEKKHEMIMSDKLPGQKVSVVSVSDEAYALLAYENYRDHWVAAWKKATFGHDSPAKTKWSRTGPPRKGEDFKAWGTESFERWGELQKLVKKDRASDVGQEAEQLMLARVQNSY